MRLAAGAEFAGPIQLTNIEQLVAIGKEAPRLSNYTARVRGVVTYCLRDLPWLYMQDGTNAGLVVYSGPHTDYPAGALIEAEGPVGAGSYAPYIGSARIQVLGPGDRKSVV